MKKKFLWFSIAAVVAISLGGWALSKRGGDATEVVVAVVGREDVQAKVTANGKVQAQKKVDISATIPGQITHLAVKEGEVVHKGQFLLQIDPVNPRAAVRSNQSSIQALLQDLQSARSNLLQARADFDRAKGNHEARIISDADFQKTKTALATNEAAVLGAQQRVDQARATLEGVQDTLAKTTIRSPIDGVVTAKRVEEGEVAVIGVQNSPGTVLLTISDMSVVETEMEVDETSIPAVHLAQPARIRVDAYPNQTFDGVVTEVGSSPISGTGSTKEAIKFKVKVRFEKPPADIKPGLSAQADILTGHRDNALVVPIQALVLRDAEKKPGEKRGGPAREVEGVYLMEGGKESGKVRFQPITTGLQGELAAEVVAGLKGGETLITGPFKALRTLKPGDAVKLEKPKKGEGRPAA